MNGKDHVPTTKLTLLLKAKINGTQSRMLGSQSRIDYTQQQHEQMATLGVK